MNEQIKQNKVLFILPNLTGGGAERVIFTVHKELANKNHPVELMTLDSASVYKNSASYSIIARSLFQNENKKVSFIRKFFRLRRLIQNEKPTAVVSTITGANLLNIFTALSFWQRPYKCIIREANTPSLRFSQGSLKSKLIVALARWLFRYSNLVIAPSKGVAEDAAQFYNLKPDRVKIIENPIDFDKIKQLATEPIDPKDKALFQQQSLVAMGRLTYAKGFDTLIEAFAQVRAKTEASLVILGDGPLKSDLKAHTKKLGLDQHVHFLGFRENPYPYLQQASCFVLSSRWEGSPNALLQAMTIGCPVVSTNCKSGPNEVIIDGENGFLVEVDNATDLADKIRIQLDKSQQVRPKPEDLYSHRLEAIIPKWESLCLSEGVSTHE